MAERVRISSDVGGALALEFANTAGWHLGTDPAERLQTWHDVERWAIEQGTIAADGESAPTDLARAVDAVVELREAMFRTFIAAARARQPEPDDVAAIMAAASEPLPSAAWSGGRLAWRLRGGDPASQLRGIVARDALALLSSERIRRVRVCDGGECGWVFLDESRGRPRRWCSMGDCGNRAKARDAYARRRSGRAGSPT